MPPSFTGFSFWPVSIRAQGGAAHTAHASAIGMAHQGASKVRGVAALFVRFSWSVWPPKAGALVALMFAAGTKLLFWTPPEYSVLWIHLVWCCMPIMCQLARQSCKIC